MARGHIATDQIAFTPGTYTSGNAVTTDSAGQLVDSGIAINAGSGPASGTHTEILTDSSGPITSNGDFIYVTGVPN